MKKKKKQQQPKTRPEISLTIQPEEINKQNISERSKTQKVQG